MIRRAWGDARSVYNATMNNGKPEAVWHNDNLSQPHATEDKARRVRRMFDAIAPTYELVNSVFSVGRDHYWRRRAVQLAAVTPRLRAP